MTDGLLIATLQLSAAGGLFLTLAMQYMTAGRPSPAPRQAPARPPAGDRK